MTDNEKLTREDLIALCERAVVNVGKWHDRDSAHAQEQIGTAWALLNAGCEWALSTDPRSDNRTVWVKITYPSFHAFEEGPDDRDHWNTELFYIPTGARLDATTGKDWY